MTSREIIVGDKVLIIPESNFCKCFRGQTDMPDISKPYTILSIDNDCFEIDAERENSLNIYWYIKKEDVERYMPLNISESYSLPKLI